MKMGELPRKIQEFGKLTVVGLKRPKETLKILRLCFFSQKIHPMVKLCIYTILEEYRHKNG